MECAVLFRDSANGGERVITPRGEVRSTEAIKFRGIGTIEVKSPEMRADSR